MNEAVILEVDSVKILAIRKWQTKYSLVFTLLIDRFWAYLDLSLGHIVRDIHRYIAVKIQPLY